VLEPGEVPDPGKPQFKASPESLRTLSAGAISQVHERTALPFGGEAPIVEAGGAVYQHCCSEGTGDPVRPLNSISRPPSTGARSVLYLRVAFPDVLRSVRRQLLSTT